MEINDVYDKNRQKTGRTIVRGSSEKLSENEFRLVVFVCVFNSKGELLIQQRQPFKSGWAGYWDAVTAGGAAVSGETSQQAAARELFEEVGIRYDFENSTPHFTINTADCFCDFYLTKQEVNIAGLELGKGEVAQVKWVTKEDMFHMIDNERFIPVQRGLVELCFGLNERRNTLTRDEKAGGLIT